MNTRLLALGALAIMTSQAANAATIYDTYNVGSQQNTGGTDGSQEGDTYLAASFSVAGTPDLSVTLALGADSSADGGSVMVYLVPDDGTGGYSGTAGTPNINANGSFAGGTLVDTIADSTLNLVSNGGGTPTLVTFSIPSTTLSEVGNVDQEYWIGLDLSDDSSGEWFVNGDGSGSGNNFLTQADYNDSSMEYSFELPGGAFEMAVNGEDPAATPEPATIAILGGALTGLGWMRRRKTNKA